VSVLAIHPETGALEVLTEEQLVHMRISGWMLKSEYDEAQAAKAAAADAAAQSSKPKSDGK